MNINKNVCIENDYKKRFGGFVSEIFASHHSMIQSEKARQGWKLRKEKLAKLKTPATTSVSKKIK